MLKLLRKIANRRRPDTIDENSFSWKLARVFGRTIRLVVMFRSEDPLDFRPMVQPMTMIMLHGRIQENIGPPVQLTTMVMFLSGSLLGPLTYKRFCKDASRNFQLLPPQNFEDAILDLPGWMSAADVQRNTDKHAWYLEITHEH
jgi:hypothetical protein